MKVIITITNMKLLRKGVMKTSSKNEDNEKNSFLLRLFYRRLKKHTKPLLHSFLIHKKRKEFPMSAAINFDGCSFLFGKLGGKTTNTKELIIYMV